MTSHGKAMLIVYVTAAGVLALGAAVASAATAVADPPPPADPVLVPPGASPPPPDAPPPPPGPTIPGMGQLTTGFGVLAQTGTAQNQAALGAPPVVGLDQTTVLGQNPMPSLPNAGPGAVPDLNVFNNQYGIQQNLVPSALGQGQMFDVPPGREHDDVSRREWFGRFIDMQRAGLLKGGLLGQMPQEQLGEPLPGTAPPPGTNIPPGLVQFQPDPPPPPGAPSPPPPGAPPLPVLPPG
jgi:hypothetical protein